MWTPLYVNGTLTVIFFHVKLPKMNFQPDFHSALVPYLGEKSGGKRKLQDTDEIFTLITNLLKSLVTSSTHLLMIGAAGVPFVYILNGFVKTLLETGKNFWWNTIKNLIHLYFCLWGNTPFSFLQFCSNHRGSDFLNSFIQEMKNYLYIPQQPVCFPKYPIYIYASLVINYPITNPKPLSSVSLDITSFLNM